jgi:crossover junction endodeoxyribonuclease RusA
MRQITFTVYARPEPQGSMRGFNIGGRVILTSNNKKMKPYRQELTHTAQVELGRLGVTMPVAGKHIPVSLVFDFFLARPPSVPKKRKEIVVKPDIDKLIRASVDALTGILYLDDAQVIEVSARKHYGVPERVNISMTVLEGNKPELTAVDMNCLFSPDLET